MMGNTLKQFGLRGITEVRFKLERKSGVPLYIQIKEQILEHIQEGRWDSGQRLPTERQLAAELAVSRNTVSTAYQELEAEGVLTSYQGRGTFITTVDRIIRREGNKDRILKMVDLALEEAMDLGFSIDEFIGIIGERVREKKQVLSRVKAIFIECNQEQADFICQQLFLGTGITIRPVLLDEVKNSFATIEQLFAEADLILTTFFHLEEVQELVREEKKLLGIGLEPVLNNVVRIAQIYPAKPAYLVCLTENFAHSVKLNLSKCGIDADELSYTTTRDPERLKEVLGGAQVLLTSPGRKREVEALVGSKKEVIEFILMPDQGSINRLKTAILELRS
jgi:DNA-binding transcriptional regulator YhcF (GntR family)